jgi:hypothetical protein
MIQVCCLRIFTSMVNQFSMEFSMEFSKVTSKAGTTDAQQRTIRKAGTVRRSLKNEEKPMHS